MNIKQSNQKPKTLSELFGKDPEAFERFLQEKNRVLAEMEKNANERVLLVLENRLAWAA